MQNITKKDIEFLDLFLSDDLTEERLKALDVRLLDPGFKAYYELRLEEKYDKPKAKIFADYLPMIIMVALVVIGIYLFIKSK
ncbi:MAG: hypothetical protein ACI86M_000098 [Saprospiraceae bacterium]|jgi:hypothetical protein